VEIKTDFIKILLDKSLLLEAMSSFSVFILLLDEKGGKIIHPRGHNGCVKPSLSRSLNGNVVLDDVGFLGLKARNTLAFRLAEMRFELPMIEAQNGL
jgi:hypothetical protein